MTEFETKLLQKLTDLYDILDSIDTHLDVLGHDVNMESEKDSGLKILSDIRGILKEKSFE